MIYAFILKQWKWLVLLALVALLGVQEVRVSRAKTEASEARAALASDRATYAQAAATQEKAARAEESRREAEKTKVIEDARTQTATAEAAARDAAGAAAGLRKQVASLIASRRASPANPGTAAGSSPAPDAIELLADVLGRVDDRAGELAAYADSSRIAGEACTRAYQSLR